MYDLARKTKEDVVPVNNKFHSTMPTNVSMDLSKLNELLNGD